jgi:hypothetical protein
MRGKNNPLYGTKPELSSKPRAKVASSEATVLSKETLAETHNILLHYNHDETWRSVTNRIETLDIDQIKEMFEANLVLEMFFEDRHLAVRRVINHLDGLAQSIYNTPYDTLSEKARRELLLKIERSLKKGVG